MSQPKTSTSSAANRRRSRRCAVNTMARVECRKGALGLGPNLIVAVQDISETGARVVLKAALPAGQDVELLFTASGLARPVKRVGKVVWACPLENGHCCAGVDFDKPLRFAELHRFTRALG